MVNGVAVDTSPGRISTDGATLTFSPLAASDTGNYTCTLTTTILQNHVTVQGAIQSEVQSLIVEGKRLYYISFPCLSACTIPPALEMGDSCEHIFYTIRC